MNNAVFSDVMLFGFVSTDVSEEYIANIIRVNRISGLGTILGGTSN
jgi:hypothetical protein